MAAVIAATDISAGDLLGLLLGNGGLLIALIVAVWSVVRGDWIPRKAHEAIVRGIVEGRDATIKAKDTQCAEYERRADRYEELALRLLNAADEATHVARELATKRGAE